MMAAAPAQVALSRAQLAASRPGTSARCCPAAMGGALRRPGPQRFAAAVRRPLVPSAVATGAAVDNPAVAPWAHIDPRPEDMQSTNVQRGWVATGAALVLALAGKGIIGVDSDLMAAACVAGAVVGYLFADFATGVYHWGVDNWGDDTTPLVGAQIADFQGHHHQPWVITQRQFCNNIYRICIPASAFAVGSLLLPLPPFVNLFVATGTFFICLSQQFHMWSHSKKSVLPLPVLLLQDAGLLISRKAHGAHHLPPFRGNYCIVSGIFNGPLDNSGFFNAMEKKIHAATGIEPRCWKGEAGFSAEYIAQQKAYVKEVQQD